MILANLAGGVKLLRIESSESKLGKYRAIFEHKGEKRGVIFGKDGNYLDTQDEEEKQEWIQKNLTKAVAKPMTKQALVRWITWNKKTLEESTRDFKRRFNI